MRTKTSFVRLPSARGEMGRTISQKSIHEDVKTLLKEMKKDDNKPAA